MRVIIELNPDEAIRQIEEESDENIYKAYQLIIRALEDVCTKYQIRYDDIYHTGE